MELSNLTFIVTDDCNFNCSYCFQKKENKTINNTIIKKAVNFFYPFLKKENKIHIGFYGGEPLLAFDQIKYATQLLLERNRTGNKQIEFSLTTNGSLLTEQMLDFFSRYRFALMLSFDGLAQDMGRKRGTLDKMAGVMKRIRHYSGINFEINSVFSPMTIHLFSQSLLYIIEQGGSDITFDLSIIEEWSRADTSTLEKELQRLIDYLLSHYKETGQIPVKNFRAYTPAVTPGIFRCGAGREQMAVTPGGKVWGCFLFHDYFKGREKSAAYRDYSFGTLTDFISCYKKRYPEIMDNYAELWQGYFCLEEDFCFLCPEVESCMVCPVNAAYVSGSLGRVSDRQCRLNKIQMNASRNFRQRLNNS